MMNLSEEEVREERRNVLEWVLVTALVLVAILWAAS